MNHDILDEPVEVQDDYRFYMPWFQMAGMAFYIVAIILNYTFFNVNLITFYIGAFIVFIMVKLILERKHNLITNYGVLLKLLFYIFGLAIITGALFKIMSWPYAAELILYGYAAAILFLLVFPWLLKDVTKNIKICLSIIAFYMSIGILLSLASIEGWPFVNELEKINSTNIVLVFVFIYLYKQKMTPKEYYHSNWYVFFGFVVFCTTMYSLFRFITY